MEYSYSYSFDDVLITPRKSDIKSRSDISLRSKLTKTGGLNNEGIYLNMPIVSSPMDTVTENTMAIAMAMNGGIGIIHRFQPIETQVEMVKKVKRHFCYIINDPYTINENSSINELKELMEQTNVSGILVVDPKPFHGSSGTTFDYKFVGVVSKKDIEVNILSGTNYTLVKDIMTKYDKVKLIKWVKTDQTISVPLDENFEQMALNLFKEFKVKRIPIIDDDDNIVGLVSFKNLMYFHNNKDIASLDTNGKLIVGGAIGVNGDYLERAEQLIEAGVDLLNIDVANGYTQMMFDTIQFLKNKYPHIPIMAGNVCTSDGYEFLCKAGADCIRVGIGNGCFTEDTKVLMANGIYKNINKIEIGEYVINKYGKPVKVLNVMNQGKKQVMKINTNNWHKDFFVTPDHKYWIGDLNTTSYNTIQSSGIAKLLDRKTNTKPKESKYKWKSISEIDNEKMFTLMPNKFEWTLPDNFTIDLSEYNKEGIETCGNLGKIKFKRSPGIHRFKTILNCNYKLGYVFGTYLGDGHKLINENNGSGSCHWSFNLHKRDIANKVKDYIKELLDYDCIISIRKENVLSVNCYNKCFTYLLNQFDKKINKQLPNKYYCTNIEYIKGLYDGLIDSDGHIEYNKSGSMSTNTSEYLIELFNWCCMNLNISFCSMKNKKTIGNLKGANLQQLYNIKIHTLNRYTKDYVYSKVLSKKLCTIGTAHDTQETWDIEVDCDTHSFIANNSIVHNSICSTRLETGIGLCQFSALQNCSFMAKKHKVPMISDGGHNGKVGNKFKALAVGCNFVLLGRSLAGTTESPGDIIHKKGKKVKYYRGMASAFANISKQEKNGNKKINMNFHTEGVSGEIEYKGSVVDVLKHICNGMRSGMSYLGVSSIKELHSIHVQFTKITSSGIHESNTRI
jgi:IMP dehydrogenase/GMP reductase